MNEQLNQATHDEWQTQLYEAIYQFSSTLRKLNDTNPWPENAVLGQAINTLATELWDRRFHLSEIQRALEEAAADLPRYAADQEVRP
ncbi:hypothetical protein [Sphingopyxis sp.]|uniref:hypothetical protein n=1 Tax=Sphingopyxis sp. TaxID=1908224 RepID=UPI0035B43CF4